MSDRLYVEESYVNATEGCRIGDSGIHESAFTAPGDLYRACQHEFGRCTGKVYVDTDNGPQAVGWVFVERQQYTDTHEPYLREVWVTVHERPPEVSRAYHYAAIG